MKYLFYTFQAQQAASVRKRKCVSKFPIFCIKYTLHEHASQYSENMKHIFDKFQAQQAASAREYKRDSIFQKKMYEVFDIKRCASSICNILKR